MNFIVELRKVTKRYGTQTALEEALVMSDRVAVIHHGRLEQVGTGEEIYDRLRTRFVAEFMGVENFIETTCVATLPEGNRFKTSAGQWLWANHAVELAQGSPATLAVRPEAVRISLAPPDPPPGNLLAGEVIEAIFEGGSRRWAVELGGGLRVVAREPHAAGPSSADGLVRGARVYLTWEPARSLVYPRAPSGEFPDRGKV